MPNRARLLEMALKGLEADRAKLDEEIAEIKREIGHRPSAAAEVETAVGAPPATQKKRRMSAEARRKISEGMKRRYAELNRLAGSKK
jgi:hypothetical protein